MVSKYAIHNSGVTFSLRSLSGSGGGSGLEVRTQAQNSVADNVACVYGSAAAKELVPLEVNDEVEGPLRFSCRGMASSDQLITPEVARLPHQGVHFFSDGASSVPR